MLKPNDVYKKVEDNWVSRFILDEVVIMPLCRSDEDVQYIYSISNETGSRIWQLLDGNHSVRDIQETLKSEYQGQGEVIETEILEFIGELYEAELIQKVAARIEKVNQHRASSIENRGKKKTYKTPEIAKIKMQPEQAVLVCCISTVVAKLGGLTGLPTENYVRCNNTSTCYYSKCYTQPVTQSYYTATAGWS